MELDVRALVAAMEAQDVEAASGMIKQFRAAAAGDESDALETLRRARDRVGMPLVSLAVRLGLASVLDALLDCGCACQEKPPAEEEEEDGEDDIFDGCSPLCEAVELGHDDCALVLVAYGASVDAPSHLSRTDYTPIHTGVRYGWKGSFFYDDALAMSLDIDARDMEGDSPLHLAVVYSVYYAAQELVAAGADPRATAADDRTLLHVTARNVHTRLAVWLLDDCVVDVDGRDAYGNTPLLEALFVGQHRMQRVAFPRSQDNLAGIVNILLDHGADIEATNRDGNTAIFGAVWNGFTDAVLVLLARGASLRTTNHRGETVLHVAARSEKLLPSTAWEALLRAGTDTDARDCGGRSVDDIILARSEAPEKLEEVRALIERLRL